MANSKKVAERRRDARKQGTNPLAEIDDELTGVGSRGSTDLIYQTIMRGGGEPFGRPWEAAPTSLTEKIVKLFKQKGFFGFESMDKGAASAMNKFTRYAASRFFGKYRDPRRK
jgi:hypothetical protein